MGYQFEINEINKALSRVVRKAVKRILNKYNRGGRVKFSFDCYDGTKHIEVSHKYKIKLLNEYLNSYMSYYLDKKPPTPRAYNELRACDYTPIDRLSTVDLLIEFYNSLLNQIKGVRDYLKINEYDCLIDQCEEYLLRLKLIKTKMAYFW